LTTPLSYLPGIVGTSYFKQFANQDRIPLKVIKYTLLLTLISCVVFVLLIRPVVDFLYRESYYIVGTYASWLAIGFCIHGLGDMLNRFLGSHGQGVAIRNASFSCGIIKIFGYIVLVYFFDINGALITNIVSSIIYCLVLVHYYRRFVAISGIKS
jgi:O-antigen/teichoic acid export membrane protein